MGRSISSTHRVEVTGWSASCWNTKDRPAYRITADGPATDAGLAAWMDRYLASTQPGGCNEHLAKFTRPRSARIVNQNTGEVVATWTAPMFEAMV